jgi:hypothetical protein
MIDEDIENHVFVDAAVDASVCILPRELDVTMFSLFTQKTLNGIQDGG